MRVTLSQQKFLDSEAATLIHEQLVQMMNDKTFNTSSTYAATRENNLPFDEKHMNYLSDHPKLNPDHCVANLRLMTRIKR